MPRKLQPITLKDFNYDSLTKRIESLLNRPNQNWYVIKRGDLFQHDYRIYYAVMKQGDETFVNSRTES